MALEPVGIGAQVELAGLGEAELLAVVRGQPRPEHVAIIMDGNGRWAARRGIDHVVQATRDNAGLTLMMAFNYGGRDELIDACRALARQVQAGELQPEEIGEKEIQRALYTADVPDPDLLIRTSGEMRVSNFLLWQIAYTELWITPTLWPDFAVADLYRAIAEFQRRTRRFGGVERGMGMKRITLLGATGSNGLPTLDLVPSFPA